MCSEWFHGAEMQPTEENSAGRRQSMDVMTPPVVQLADISEGETANHTGHKTEMFDMKEIKKEINSTI